MRRLLLLCLCALPLVLAACGDDKTDVKSRQTAPTQAATQPAAEQGCAKVAEPKPRSVKKRKAPSFRVDPDKTYTAVLKTSCGTIAIELATDKAPKTTSSFVSLVKSGFYDGLGFHRVVPGFVVQGGDPKGNGSGGPGYHVVEAPPDDLKYTRGIVAMAKTQLEKPGTSGSQFFIVTGSDVGLPPDYALVGHVVKGDDVLERIGSVENDPADNKPLQPVVIEDASIRVS